MESKKMSVICLVLACAAFTSVQSASFYYRTGRELEIPVENEIIREEIVSELKREPEVAIIETEPITAIIKEEVVIPVEQLRVAAPAIEVQEPVAVISEKEETNAVVEEAIVEEALRSAGAETIIPVVVEEKIVSVPIVEEPVAVAAVEEPLPKTRNEPLVNVDEKLIEPVPEVKTEVKETPVEEVAVAEKSNPVEEAVVVEKENVVIADAPVLKEDEAIRQSEGAAAPAGTTVRPTVIQALQTQFTNQIQNFQNQIQSVFNPNAANSASTVHEDSTVATTARPNVIAQFQQAVGQVFNRPAGAQGPFQGIVSAVQQNFQNAQTNFQGLFRPPVAAAAAPTVASPTASGTVPVVIAPADPVAEKTMLGEVPVVNEPAAVVEKVEEKDDEKKSE